MLSCFVLFLSQKSLILPNTVFYLSKSWHWLKKYSRMLLNWSPLKTWKLLHCNISVSRLHRSKTFPTPTQIICNNLSFKFYFNGEMKHMKIQGKLVQLHISWIKILLTNYLNNTLFLILFIVSYCAVQHIANESNFDLHLSHRFCGYVSH